MKRSVAELVRSLTVELEASIGGPTVERRREVEILLAHCVDLPERTRLYTANVTVTSDARLRLGELVSRRGAGEPVAYLTGTCEFYGLAFEVDPTVLIPRPETEHVVEESIRRLGMNGDSRILEVGVGSGAISIALLRERRGAHAVATDISPSALGIAAKNAARHEVAGRLTLVEADLFPDPPPRVDLVVSNPPYVALDDPLPAEVRNYEPDAALYAGESGLEVIERLVRGAPGSLVAGGALVLEVGVGQAREVSVLMGRAGFADLAIASDIAGIERVVSGTRAD